MPAHNMPKAEQDQERIIFALERISVVLEAIAHSLEVLVRARPPTTG
jgi:hypothetical protein